MLGASGRPHVSHREGRAAATDYSLEPVRRVKIGLPGAPFVRAARCRSSCGLWPILGVFGFLPFPDSFPLRLSPTVTPLPYARPVSSAEPPNRPLYLVRGPPTMGEN